LRRSIADSQNSTNMYNFKRIRYRHLQGLSRRSFRVDGEGELVDDDNDEKDKDNRDGGQNDVPSSAGAPLLELGDIRIGGGDGVRERAARTLRARSDIRLHGVGKTDETQESNDDGGEGNENDDNHDDASQRHSEGEDNLVADGVKEENRENNGNDERENQSDQNERLSKLDSGVDLGGSSAGVSGTRGSSKSVSGGLGLSASAIEVVEDLGVVKNAVSLR